MRRGISGFLVALASALTSTHLQAQTVDVSWRANVGVSVSGNDLTKTATAGWGNAGASSLQGLDADGFVEFSGSGSAMLGLSKGDTNQSYTDIDFALYLNNGTLTVYESGYSKGSFGAYTGSDRFRVEAASGVVRYRKNGAVIYTSATAAGFPLLVDTALNSNGSTLTDVRIGRTSFRGDVGVTVSEGTLTKVGTTGWNAGAVSAPGVLWGDGFVEFSAQETDKRRAAGLSRGDSDQTGADIDFAVVVNADASVEVQEGGVSRGVFGSYVTGDRFRVEVRDEAVSYFQNGLLLYSSGLAPAYPLAVDTALYDTGATLADVVVSDLVWTAAAGVAVSASSLTKTGTEGWNAGASSTGSIGGDGFVEFTANETNTTRACGLADEDAGYDPAEIDFAIRLENTGEVRVYESGVSRGTFGSYAPGDRFRVEVQLGQVVYRKNGVVFYTSGVIPAFPLFVDAALDTPGATLWEIRLGNLVWKNEGGVAVWGYRLLDTGAAGWGNSGAASTIELAAGDGAVEYTATDTYTYRMLGLSNGDTNRSYTDIDFALGAQGGILQVWEKGAFRASFGTYAVDDRVRVAVEGGVVRYYRNASLLYTSSQAVQYPLLVDTALSTPGAALADVWVAGSFGPAPVEPPAFNPAGGTYTAPPTVAMSSTTPFAEIRYTTDGTEPVPSSTLYTQPISIGTTTTLKAKAWRSGLTPSTTSSATYQMSFGALSPPVITPGSGAYEASQEFTLSAAAGATIRYTTDGTDPSTGSPVYTTPLTFQVTTTLKAKAYHPDFTTSAASTATYTIRPVVPVLSLPGGAYPAGQAVTVSHPDAAVTLRYTLDGLDPAATDPVVAVGGSLVVGNFTLKVRAFKTGCNPSDVASATYSVSGQLTAGMVAAGEGFSMALLTDGTAFSWGYNASGRLGDGTTTERWVPGPVRGLTGIVAIATGSDHGLALDVNGLVWSWGANVSGQLGDGTTTARSSPAPVPGLSGVAAISAGKGLSAALRSDGTLWLWGENGLGQVGVGGTTDRLSPVQVLSDVAQVAAGWYHVLAVKTDGSLWSWGYNNVGQLGDGGTTSRSTPGLVPGLSSVGRVGAGESHSMAQTSSGALYAWGENGSGQIGDSTTVDHTTPTLIASVTGTLVLDGGASHSLAVLSDARAAAWGENSSGQIGDGTTTDRLSPMAVAGLSGIGSVGGGDLHSLALASDGSIWSWGGNASGRLGDGTNTNRLSPVKVRDGELWKVGTPRLSPEGGSFTYAPTVTITESTAGATIHYTTNGAEPTPADPSIASGSTLVVDVSQTLKAKAWKDGMAASDSAAAVYALTMPQPSVSLATGTYNTPRTATVTCAVTGATIHYTATGLDPTTADPVASGAPIDVDRTQVFKAKAWKAGWAESAVASRTYTMAVAAPVLAPGTGTYATSQVVTVTTATPGATLNYTTSGREPGPADLVIASGGSFAVDHSTTLTVIGRRAGWSTSPVTTASYYLVAGTASTPAFDPLPASFTEPVTVRLSTTTPGAVLRYTVDGSEPGITSPVYLAPLLVDATTTVKARAFAPDRNPSATATGTFTITSPGSVATPVLAPGPARYETGRLVTATSATPDASVRYTTNGVDPTAGDPLLGAGVLVDRALILSARGFKDGLAPSATRAGFYLVTGALTSGEGHILALAADGVVWAWGQNSYGQLGDGTTNSRSTPAAISGLSNIVAVAAGGSHSLALDAQGRVWAWGSNSRGQIGDGTTTNRLAPQLVPGMTGVSAIAAGYANSFAVKSDGSASSWGDNTSGILGDGTNTQRTSPVPIAGLAQVKAISAGRFHTLAVTVAGQAWSWGDNYYGALGDGTFQPRFTPAVVPGMTGVTAVAAGRSFSAALKTDGRESGSVWTWGLGTSGQLGYGNPNGAWNPRPGLVLDRVLAVQAGTAHVLALTQDGTVLSWGEGGGLWGRLGDGAHVNRFQPVVVADLGDAVSLSAGIFHSAAIHADGGVSAWGYNVPGLGSDTPVRVPGLTLVANQWLGEDGDADRLTAWDEWRSGCDPYRGDSNGDGIPDDLAVALGLSCASLDTDGDGLLNADEERLGTSVTAADSDGDGSLDGLDCAPLDPGRSACAVDPNDHTPPTITLQEPPNATPLP